MRTMWIAMLLVAGVTGACGKNKESSDKGAEGPATIGPEVTDPGKAPPPAPPARPAEPAAVMPADVPADKVLSVAELDAIMKRWAEGTEVSVAGYPTFYIGDEADLRTELDLAAQPAAEHDDRLVTCELAAPPAKERVSNKTPVVMKGKLAGLWPPGEGKQVRLKDCVLVSRDKPFDAAAPAVPGGAAPIPADKLHLAIAGWIGKQLTVTGVYFGTTISKNKDGKPIEVRFDLLTAAGDFEPKVGCHLPLVEPTPELDAALNKNRDSVTVRGKFKEVVFGAPQLEPCAPVL